jgi:hypothetical protein
VPATNEGRCPLCGEPLYGWATLPGEGEPASVGRRVAPEAGTRVLDRCEECGVVVERGRELDLGAELVALSGPGAGGKITIDCANRASLQAFLGGAAWAPLDRLPGRLALTPRSLELLAERNGYQLGEISFPPTGRSMAWMWQTIVNALTLRNNFARDMLAGRIRPTGTRERLAAGVDAVASVLAAPLVALVAIPLEAIASTFKRGGRMIASAERSSTGSSTG